MARLEDIAVEELERALETATTKTETKRLIAAIIYKRGPSVPMIAEWLGIRDQTIYTWFDRLETEPLEQALQERARSGRPAKLTDSDREEFLRTVQRSPREVGYDHPTWTAAVAQRFLEEEFDVTYSRRHVQRLLETAGPPGEGS